jgi:GTPase SAR1 family protein
VLNITKGKVDRAQKTVIYGPEGIGKTTLAAHFPDPVVIDTEGGTAFMDIRRIDKPASWEELINIVKEVAATPGICKTLVIDTADWAEQLVTSYICTKYKVSVMEKVTRIWPKNSQDFFLHVIR